MNKSFPIAKFHRYLLLILAGIQKEEMAEIENIPNLVGIKYNSKGQLLILLRFSKI